MLSSEYIQVNMAKESNYFWVKSTFGEDTYPVNGQTSSTAKPLHTWAVGDDVQK